MRARERHLLLALLALAGCERRAAPALSADTPLSAALPPPAPAPALQVPTTPAPTTSAGTDPRLPVLGDPLGLLSRPPPASAHQPSARPRAGALDPSALMAGVPGPAAASAELTARPGAAPNRAPSALQEKTARDVVRRASQGGARVHVLLLYASYCKACRSAMPRFVQLARAYKARGVAFTAASVDRDREAFAAYASVLEDALEPLWILPDTGTKAELARAGIALPNDSFSIPLFAVFAGQNRLVAQGNSRELNDLPSTLDGLL